MSDRISTTLTVTVHKKEKAVSYEACYNGLLCVYCFYGSFFSCLVTIFCVKPISTDFDSLYLFCAGTNEPNL